MIHHVNPKLKAYFADESGTATIEFVIWFPLLMFWLLGIVVFFDAFKSRSALTTANATVADIVSRSSEVSEDYIDLLQLLQTSLLLGTSGNGLRISSIQFTIDPDILDDPGTYTVLWSDVAGSATVVLVDDEIRETILPDMYSSETVLLVESFAPYAPMTQFVGLKLQTLRSAAAISPRYESRVVWVE